jgi:phosphate starvation-inducible PhoH-like protein
MKEIVNEEIELKDAKHIPFILGVIDRNKKIMEKELGVNMILRNEKLFISGDENAVRKAKELVRDIESLARKRYNFSIGDLIYSVKNEKTGFLKNLPETVIIVDTKGREITPKTFGQRKYVDAVMKNSITFVIGPAGTGKTYLSVALSVKYLLSGKVNRIILTRPVIEAGEKLGFLPGDIQQKVDPYFRPIYDALYDFLGQEKTYKLLTNKTIEIAPLAYMRGRTLNDAFIILDEAQNTTFSQMKMFLTRLGEGSKMVITGDVTQSDLLPMQGEDGLQAAARILKHIKGIEFVYLTGEDVVRHKLVQKIIDAYEKGENGKKKQ